MQTSNAKRNPIPVRLDQSEDQQISALAKDTGLSKSEILRRACRVAFPKFISGEVDIARVPAAEAAAAEPDAE